MEQKTITGQAFRVLTDAVNGVFHRVSLWTHANDVEMENGDTLTEAMNDKYNISKNTLVITSLNDIEPDTFGQFVVHEDVGTISVGDVILKADNRYEYGYFAYNLTKTSADRVIVVFDYETVSISGEIYGSPVYVLKKTSTSGGWIGSLITSKKELNRLQYYLEYQIAELDKKKMNHVTSRPVITSLEDVEMNQIGTLVVTQSKTIGYYDSVTNITTYLMPAEYMYVSHEDLRHHKTIVMFSNSKGESDLFIGGGYVCTNTGMTGAPWIITRILSPTDFSTDETGLREQIVASLTGQLWPVGAIYINLTRENPGNFLGGTWNLITEGILTAIKGSPEQTGYHQRDLYKAVKDEDRGEHLYGVFAWQRIA